MRAPLRSLLRPATFLLASVLSACGGAVDAGSSTSPDSPDRDSPPGPVTGTVVGADGAPLVGVPVLVGDATYTTDAQGQFHAAQVASRYDVVITRGLDVFEYDGMTGRTPRFSLAAWDGPRLRADEGTRHTHLKLNLGENVGWTLAVTGAGVQNPAFAFNGSDGVIEGDLTWSGAAAASLRLKALRYERDGAGNVARFTGFASVSGLISQPTATFDAVFLPVPFGTRAVEVTVDAPADYSHIGADLIVRDGDDDVVGGMWVPAAVVSGSVIRLLVPDVPGASFSVDAYASEPAVFSLSRRRAFTSAAELDGARLTIERGPEIRSPTEGATGVTAATELGWTPYTGGVNFVIADPDGPGSLPRYHLATARGSARIPDAARLGVTWPQGKAYRWAVFGTNVARTVDEFAGLEVGAASGTTYAYTPYRGFTFR